MRGDWVNMQRLTDRRKDKQICMHDRETEIGRQMERGKDRSKFTDITGVGLCRRACVGSRCECTRACAAREGGLRTMQWRLVIWNTEKPSCAETGQSDGLGYITQTHTCMKEHNCHYRQRSAGLVHVSSRCNCKPPLWCASSSQQYVLNKTLYTISHWHASLIPLFIFAAMCPEVDAIMPDGDVVSLSAGRALLDDTLWQGENNSLSDYKYNMFLMCLYPNDRWRNVRAGKYLFVALWPYLVMIPPPHSLAISELLFYNTFNPKLFCNKHQMFSIYQNDFYGLKRTRHGGLGDEIQLFTFIYL